MIEALYLDPVYWLSVLALLAISSLLTRSRLLGFRFIVLLLLSQYTVHALMAYGFGAPVAFFCLASLVLFVAASLPFIGTRLRAMESGSSPRLVALRPSVGFGARFGSAWFQASRGFLVIYWGVRLVTQPLSTGSLDLGARLVAQQQDRILFFLGQVTLPALAACAAVWLRRGRRLTWIDIVALVLVVIGLVGSDSKATLLPLLLVFFGVLEAAGRRLREFRRFAIPVGALVVLAAVRLLLYFPSQGPLGVGQTMLYRIAANTDSLEYLLVTRKSPSDFPFSGLPALLPYVAKLFGYRYDYSPGVWLYGERYGDFSGFGPNSGPVLDYFGNIGWWGLLVPLAAGVLLAVLRGRSAPQAVALASIVYLAFVDVTLLDLPLLLWGPVAGVILIIAWRPLSPRWQHSRALGLLRRLSRSVDAPIPRLRTRRRSRHRAASTSALHLLRRSPAGVDQR